MQQASLPLAGARIMLFLLVETAAVTGAAYVATTAPTHAVGGRNRLRVAFDPCTTARSSRPSIGERDYSLIRRKGRLSYNFLARPQPAGWSLRAGASDDDDEVPSARVELLLDGDDDEGDSEDDWTPDRVRARRRREGARIRADRLTPPPAGDSDDNVSPTPRTSNENASPYTDEEEDLIEAMGGKSRVAVASHRRRQRGEDRPQIRQRRDEGYLGDSTLHDIASDYSIPVCYIADVLCTWGVPPPIHVHDRLGDLVTGEQAFALLEAVNSIDVSSVQDRYSFHSLLSLCEEWDLDLQTAFEFCVKEGWNLPFGVQTCLRVEQEDELLRVHGPLLR